MERKWNVLIVAALAPFMGFLDLTIVNVAFPDIERSYPAASRADLSWVLNAYNIVFAALLLASGRIADRHGRRLIFLWAVTTFTLGSVIAMTAPTAALLIAGRVVQGIGAAALMPSSLALVLVEFPRTQQATAIGVMGAVAAVSSALGPTIGGLLVDGGGWRWAFAINIPIGLATIAAGRRVLDESRDASSRPVDGAGIALATASMALLSAGLVKGDDWGWLSLGIVSCFAGAVALGAFVVSRSARHPAPVIEVSLLRYRSFAIANGGVILFGAAFYGLLLLSVLYLTSVWGYSALQAGAAWAPMAVVTAIVAAPAGRIADRAGHRAVIVPGSVIFAAGVLWFATGVGTTPAFLDEWLPPTILTGVGIACAFPTFSSAATAALPASRFATGSGLMGAARQLGAAIGVAVVIALLGASTGADLVEAFDRAWLFAAGAGLASGFVAAAMERQIEAAAEPATALESEAAVVET